MNTKKAYSYHTFYFPFVWNNAEKISFNNCIKSFSENTKWTDISVTGFDEIKAIAEGHKEPHNDLTSEQMYQIAQYFTESARESTLGWDKKFVKYYSYDCDTIHEKAKYHIEKTIYHYDDNGTQTANSYIFDLDLNAIKLKLFNIGIGILIFETENHDFSDIGDIKRINEYGRRIFAPFIPTKDPNAPADAPYTGSHCADVLGVDYKNGCIDYSNLKNDFISCKNFGNKVSHEFIPDFILNLFEDTVIYDHIKPAIDDRMFVSCLVNSEEYFTKIENYTADLSIAKDLYEFIYIDTPERCTCQNDDMLYNLLDESIYKRWLGNKTLYATSHHSFVCLTSSKNPDVVQTPFLIQYNHIVMMVLVQRAAIIVFDEISSQLTDRFEGTHKLSFKKKRLVKKSLQFQEKYISFCNQHNNIEITCQDQGNELYAMLQRAMYVDKNNEKLEKEVNVLYEAANSANDLNMSQIALWIGILLTVAEPIIEELFSLIKKVFF